MTAITDSSAALSAAIADFATIFQAALVKKADQTDTADTSSELNGASLAETQTALDAELVAHEATNGAAHINATALAAMGVYSRAQVDAKIAKIPTSAALPISRYGELSYLPVGVAGDFQGATMNFESRWYPGIVENDGTYVFLRNGTTGSIEGVYYAYMKNAINATSMVSPTRTNFRYQPAFFPVGTTARWVGRSDGACLYGRLQSSTGVLGDYFIALTNGTFDLTKHVGATIAAANFPAIADASVNVEAFVGNTNVYFVVTPSSSASITATPVDFQLWSVSIAAIQAANGAAVTPTHLTGWSTTGFGGTFSGQTNIRVANMLVNTDGTKLPLIVFPATPTLSLAPYVDNDGNINTDSAQSSTGIIRIRVSGTAFAVVPTTGNSITQFQCFWISVNPATLTAALEGPATTAGTLAYNATTGTASYSGSMFNIPEGNIRAQPYQGGQGTACWTRSGFWLSVTDSDPPDYGSNISRVKSGAFTNRYDAISPTSFVTNRISAGFIPAYGSPLGGRMSGSWLLPGGYMMASSYGPRADGVTMEWGPVVCLPGASGYTYASQYSGSLTGYAPSIFRKRISDMGLNVDNFTCMMSEVAASGTVVASGGHFLEGYNTSGYANITVSAGTLVGTGSIGFSNAVLQALKTACWASLGIAVPPASALEVMVPQNTAIPPFAFMTWTDANKNLFACVFELAITGGSRTSTITGMSVVSSTGAIQTNTGTTLQPINSSVTWTTGACHIYEGSDAWFVGLTAKTYMVLPGTGGGHTLRFAIPKSTNRPQWSTLVISAVGITYSGPFYMGYPGLGFGECDQTPTTSDNYTKIILTVRCTTLAQYTAWAKLSAQVLVSQDVAQGWIVYFNAATPLIMNGQYVTVQPTSIDLTIIKAAPANTTFFIYGSIVGGVGKYSIFTTVQPEDVNLMYLGKVVTGASSISSIAMQKVSRVDKYRLSTTSEGSAVSVTTGTPDAAAHLAWT